MIAIVGEPLSTYTDADGETWNRWKTYTKTDAGELREINDFTAWTNADDPKKIMIMGVPIDSYKDRIEEGSPVVATGEMFITGSGVATKDKLIFNIESPWEFRWDNFGEMVYIGATSADESNEELFYAMSEAPSTFQRVILPYKKEQLNQLRYVFKNYPDYPAVKNVHAFHILFDRKDITTASEKVSEVFDYLGPRDICIDDKVTGEKIYSLYNTGSEIWINAQDYSIHSDKMTLGYVREKVEVYKKLLGAKDKSASIVFTEMDYGHGEWTSWEGTGKHCYDEHEPENTVLGMMIGLYSLGLRFPATATVKTPYGYYLPDTKKIHINFRPNIPNGEHSKELISDYAAGVLAMLAIMIEASGSDPLIIDFDEKILGTDMDVSSDPFTQNIVSLARVIGHGRIPLRSMGFGGGAYYLEEDEFFSEAAKNLYNPAIVSLALALNGSLLEVGKDGEYSFVCRGITSGAKYRIPMIEPKRHFAKIQSGLRAQKDWTKLDLSGTKIDLYGPYPYNNLDLPVTTIGFGKWLRDRGASRVSGLCAVGWFDMGSWGTKIINYAKSTPASALHYSRDVYGYNFNYDGNTLTLKSMENISALCNVSHKYNVVDISKVETRVIFNLPVDKEYIVGDNQLGEELIEAVFGQGYSIDKEDALQAKIGPVTDYYDFTVDANGDIVASIKGTTEYLPDSPIAKMRDSYLSVLNDFKAQLTGGATDALVNILSSSVPAANGGHTYLNAKIRRDTRTITHTADGKTHTDEVIDLFAGEYGYSSRSYTDDHKCGGPNNVTVGKLSVNDFVYSFDWNTPQGSGAPPYTSVSGKEICCCSVTGERLVDYKTVQGTPPPVYQPGDDELFITYTVSVNGDEMIVNYKVLDGEGNDVTDTFSTLTIGSAFLHKSFDA